MPTTDNEKENPHETTVSKALWLTASYLPKLAG